jgi:hypothetical protein
MLYDLLVKPAVADPAIYDHLCVSPLLFNLLLQLQIPGLQ